MKAGWEIKKLGEVCEFVNRGVSPKYLDEGGICVLNQKCVRNHSVNFELARRHDDRAKSVSEQRLLRRGDVLVNSTGTGTLGRVAQIREDLLEPTTVDSHVTIARPKIGLFYSEFFGYAMVAIEEEIKEAGEGCGGQTELSRSVLAEKFSIQYPKSLSEQAHIVGILDEAFASIATAKANTQKNLDNAKAVFESHLNSVFSNRGEGWVEKKLGEVCHKIGSGATPLGGETAYKQSGISLIRSLNVHDLEFKYKDLAFIDEDQAARLSNVKVEKDDVLLNITGASVARCCTVPSDVLPARVNQHVSIIRPATHELSPFFLHYLLISRPFKSNLLQVGEDGGSTRQAITKAQIQEFRVTYPSRDQQDRIVASINTLSEETSRLTSLYTQKLSALEDLKKSLLHQAFIGKL